MPNELLTYRVPASGIAKPPVEQRSATIRISHGASMLFYPAALRLSRQTLTYTAVIICSHRTQTGSCRRKLNPWQQALLVPARLREGETFAELAAGFGCAPPPRGDMSPRR